MSDSIESAITEIRREEGRKSLMAFAKAYFPRITYKPCSRFHIETCQKLDRMESERGSCFAVSAPRGHAKSTYVSELYPLKAACYGHERCIVVFSGTQSLVRRLIGHIAEEVRRNRALRRDFPDVIAKAKCLRDVITFGNGIQIMGASVGQEVRGLRGIQGRPSLIIADDVEMTDHYRSPEGRERIREWFQNTALAMGDADTNVIVAGTIHHLDSLMAHLVSPNEFGAWTKRVYRAVESFAKNEELWEQWRSILSGQTPFEGEADGTAAWRFYLENKDAMLEGTRVLWPEEDSYYAMMLYVETRGRTSFNAEKQNSPGNPESGDFPPSRRSNWTARILTHGNLRETIGPSGSYVGTCDASPGEGADFSALVVALRDGRDGRLYVVHAEHGKWKLEELTERILDLCGQYNFSAFAFESNAFQSGWADHIQNEAGRAGLHLPLKKVIHTKNKVARILRLAPIVNSGRIQFQETDRALHEELDTFPKGRNDDLVDALSMAYDVSLEVGKADPETAFRMFKAMNTPEPGAVTLPVINARGQLERIEEDFGWLIDDYK